MSIIKNYLYTVINGILLTIIPILTIPYIARVLGKEYTGIHSFTFSVCQYFVMIGVLGTLTYGNRAIAYIRDNIEKRSKTFYEIFYMNLITTFAILIVYYFFVFFIFASGLRKYYLIQSINIIAASFDIVWFFFGLEEFKKTVTRNIIIKVTGAILIFILVKDPTDLSRYIFILALSNLLGAISLWVYIPIYTHKVKIEINDVIKHFLPSIKLFIPRIAVQVYTLLDKVMLGIISTKEIVGVYELTTNITKLPLPLITSLGSVIMPRISFLYAKNNNEKIKEYINKTFRFQSYLAIFLLFMIIGCSFEFVPWYFGEGYELSTPIMIIISFTILGISWSNVIGAQLMIPLKKEKEYTISLFIGAGINFFVNFLLIPKYNAIGAAIGTSIAEMVVALSQILFVKKYLSIKKLFKDIWKYITAGFIMLFGVRIIGIYMGKGVLTNALQVLFGSTSYFFILIFLKSEINNIIINKFRQVFGLRK